MEVDEEFFVPVPDKHRVIFETISGDSDDETVRPENRDRLSDPYSRSRQERFSLRGDFLDSESDSGDDPGDSEVLAWISPEETGEIESSASSNFTVAEKERDMYIKLQEERRQLITLTL